MPFFLLDHRHSGRLRLKATGCRSRLTPLVLVIGSSVKVCTSEVVKEVKELSGSVVVCAGCSEADDGGRRGVEVALPTVDCGPAGVGTTNTVVVDVLLHNVVS